MTNVRIISRLDIKGENLIKGIQLEGLKVIGKPQEFSKKYYLQGIDELLYMDSVASLYGRNHLAEIIENTSKDIFIPLTVGGGIRSLEDVKAVLRIGADKVAINTGAIMNPDLISETSRVCGRQCVVISIEAKKNKSDGWEAYINGGRDHTGIDVVEWAIRACKLGAGEILLTSIDKDGTQKGFDLDLIHAVTSRVDIPVIASGGFGKIADAINAVQVGGVGAVAIASALHYKKFDIKSIRGELSAAGIRTIEHE